LEKRRGERRGKEERKNKRRVKAKGCKQVR
jgi:hypothetical protein